MARTYICTSGASIAAGCATLYQLQRVPTSWDANVGALREEIARRIQAHDLRSAEGRVRASAELNALHRAGAQPDDEVVLLVTDTADGRCCAEAVRDILIAHFGLDARRVAVERVEGLQVHDPERLRRQGLLNLSRRLVHYLADPQRRYGGGRVLCPNGGFKGVVPFMTLLGMLFRAPVVYVFESADCLITLPPLPLGLATDLFDRALPAIHWARQRGVFDPEDFCRQIPGLAPEERELFDSFLEVVQDGRGPALASLSPLVDVLTQQDEEAPSQLMLSARAAADLQGLDNRQRRLVEPYLHRLSSPLWRSLNLDRKHGSDLDFFPRGHQTWRFAGYTLDGLFHLCWFAQHDEYLRLIPAAERQRAAFDTGAFEPYAARAAAEVQLPDEDPDRALNWFELRAQRDELRARTADFETRLAAGAQREADLRRRIRETADAARQERERLHEVLRGLERRLDEEQRARQAAAEPCAGADSAEPHELEDAEVDPVAALAAYQGRVVEARLSERRERSLVFTLLGEDEGAPEAIVPLHASAGAVLAGVVRLRVTGHDTRRLQAIFEPGSDAPR